MKEIRQSEAVLRMKCLLDLEFKEVGAGKQRVVGGGTGDVGFW